MRVGLWLCALTLVCASYGTDDEAIHDAPIRRIVIYKDGHCFTERALTLENATTRLFLSNLPNALSGTVWASLERGGAVKSLQARWIEQERSVPAQNTAELLMLNDGRRVEVELTLPASNADAPKTRVYQGVLRVLKPELRYKDAYPTADAPSEFTPALSEEPEPRPYYYRMPELRSDFVQDEWSRAAEKATFAVEGEHGILFFKPDQLQRLQFLEPATRTRTVNLRRPVLELTLEGARRGAELKLYAVERGVRWMPEYQLLLPKGDAREATLVLNATVLNELGDLQGVQAAVVVGAPQFMLESMPSPMNLRTTFRELSRWFEDGGRDSLRIAGIPAAGFGGAPGENDARPRPAEKSAPSTAPEPMTLLALPPLTAPKHAATRVEIARQQVPIERACVWIQDLNLTEQQRWIPYTNPEIVSFRTIEDIAYRVAQIRRFREEVQEAYILRNTGNFAWTTGAALILKDGAPHGQDILFRTEPGEETYLTIGPAHGLSIAVTEMAGGERSKQRVAVRV
ncbi:MAG: hypothetical protein NZM28_01495, partial [Fimbriimonadales bacterium]|nr:hypothetical protein [Fimbriimonadales bacterium]